MCQLKSFQFVNANQNYNNKGPAFDQGNDSLNGWMGCDMGWHDKALAVEIKWLNFTEKPNQSVFKNALSS